MKNIYNSTVTTDLPIIQGHRLHGQSLLPGLAYIDMLYQLLAQVRGLDFRHSTLHRLAISNPLTVTDEQSVDLRISCEETAEALRIAVNGSTPGSADTIYITAELQQHAPQLQERIDIEQLKQGADRSLGLESAYGDARRHGLVHEGMIKARGRMFVSDASFLIEARLDREFEEQATDYLFHPTLIDGVAVAAGFLALDSDKQPDESLYIPLSYESFHCCQPMQQSCWAMVDRSSIRRVNEILSLDIDLYNQDGEQIGLLHKMTAKQLRDRPEVTIAPQPKTTTPAASCCPPEHQEIESRLQEIFARQLPELNTPLDLDSGFFELGVQSSQLLTLQQEIETIFDRSLSPTLLFEYSTLADLITYLAGLAPAAAAAIPAAGQGRVESPTEPEESGIAIIGLAGRYPQAYDLDEFWQNLSQGKDCIEEIPKERWDWQDYFSEDRTRPGHAYSRWGGFIPDMDKFDPLFFNISPREAELMDPQERLFLEHCWMAMEDAGYTREALARGTTSDLPGQVGVYAGVMFQEYALHARQNGAREKRLGLGGGISAIANRVSYIGGFHGPSLALDTACSSSLTAIHMACEALRLKQIDAALAGGVNTSVHPNKYLLLSQGQFISSHGRCESFGHGGDGYTPGEGIGVVFLKRLSEAQRDKDYIYGVIRGSAINHGGKASGFAVPNPKAQSMVIARALDQSGLPPRTISYVEAHGTGTKLGDPIEISGLNTAFARGTNEKRFCALGSVKSNIGHCESAAGIAGLTKILLQMKHEKIVPSLHSAELNPKIDFDNTPFTVNQELREWQRPVLENRTIPRRAGLSSFGAGGSNAHLVLEEYIDENEDQEGVVISDQQPALIVLSAKNQKGLRQQARRLLAAVEAKRYRPDDLAAIAYTLQVGREAMEERLAFTAASLAELASHLRTFVEEGAAPAIHFQGRAKNRVPAIMALRTAEEWQITMAAWINRGQYAKLLKLWVKGSVIDWSLFSTSARPGRIPLPTYPFARQRYWVPEHDSKPPGKSHSLMTFCEEWRHIPLADQGPPAITTLLCCLSTKEEQQAVAGVIRSMAPEAEVVFLNRGAAYAKHSQYHYTVCPHEPATFTSAFKAVADQYGSVDGLFYLWPLEEASLVQDPVTIAAMLQGLGAAGLDCGRLLLAGEFERQEERCHLESWLGFERSLAMALPRTQLAVIFGPASREGINGWCRRLLHEMQDGAMESAFYSEDGRQVCRIRAEHLDSVDSLLKNNGTYLLTGGLGGLGLLFAEYLCARGTVNLILSGRSPLNSKNRQKIKELEATGSQVFHLQADICDAKAMETGLREARACFGGLHGVIHGAGIEGGGNILDKNLADFRKVLAPKIDGTILLDHLTQDDPLDFVCYFSSSSAILGDLGSCDYAVANRFQMAYSAYRNQQQQTCGRPGKTVVINWPLWQEGGMSLESDEQTELYLKSSGQGLLTSEDGVRLFDRLLNQESSQHLVMVGDKDRVHRFLRVSDSPTVAPRVAAPPASCQPSRSEAMKDLPVEKCLLLDLKEQVSSLLKIPRDILDPEENLADFGFDSITLTEFANELNQTYKLNLTPTVFFEYSTLHDLGRYLSTEHKERLASHFAIPQHEDSSAQLPVRVEPELLPQSPAKAFASTESSAAAGTKAGAAKAKYAIVGMSGAFPMAATVDEFWDNLLKGKDCIEEIPKNRWDWQALFGDPEQEVNRTNVKWGGFIDGVDCFDPLFFGISPKEAELMDPQQRLLMTYVWKAIEDAGYSAQSLSGSKTGIFVGMGGNDYSSIIARAGLPIEGYSSIGTVPSMGPNRMSFFLDVHGPSEPVETACSSSLVAIHRAMAAMADGSCDMAIVGGVNTILSPDGHISFSRAGMLSEDGRCKTFSDQADGYVRAEGVGMIALKRLEEAEEAGDTIYGVILASAMNHGGRANSLTAPNPKAQAELVRTAIQKAGIDPKSVSYIETHGTGTKLGDPIEIQALQSAFRQLSGTQEESAETQAHCGLGSLKTNVGHLELAAGIAGVIKVLLQLKHKTLVKSLHCQAINPYIRLQGSPFYIVRKTEEWKSLKAQDGQVLPRRAGVSSFGFGGTNAHVVIEEYQAKEAAIPPTVSVDETPVVILLSAKTKAQLRKQAEQLLTVLQHGRYLESDLADIAYTLQVGRDAMEERLAMTVNSLKECEKTLQHFIDGRGDLETLYYGQVKQNREALAVFAVDEEFQETLDKWISRKKHTKLLELWVKGLAVDWQKLWSGRKRRRLSLPTYPFEQERYWIPENNAPAPGDSPRHDHPAGEVIHPLLHRNNSDISSQRFSTAFSGREFFLADHLVLGQPVLPGVAYLEMARAAMYETYASAEKTTDTLCLKDVVWIRPLVADAPPLQVRITLLAEEDGETPYRISSTTADNKSVVHSQGRAVLLPQATAPVLNLSALREECAERTIDAVLCYRDFSEKGIDYGPALQTIRALHLGPDSVLAQLSLPPAVAGTEDQFYLHPSLLDGALQASAALDPGIGQASHGRGPALPFVLEKLEIFRACPTLVWVLVRPSTDSPAKESVRKFDFDLCDEQGTVCVRMRGFSVRPLASETQSAKAVVLKDAGDSPPAAPPQQTMLLTPLWDPEPVEQAATSPLESENTIIIGGNQESRSAVLRHCPQARHPELDASQSIDELTDTLSTLGAIDHIIWITPPTPASPMAGDRLIEEQNRGVLFCFRLIKALLRLGYGAETLAWTVITEQAQAIHATESIRPAHASVHGLMGSLAKEYTHWPVRVVDMPENGPWPLEKIFSLPAAPDGNVLAYRGQEWFRRFLLPTAHPEQKQEIYRQGGVYVVIGGAGGVGAAWSEHMIRCHQAHIIWIGRRPIDAALQQKLDALARLGPAPHYIAADATDLLSLHRAYVEIKTLHPKIHGIIHSALVLQDQSLMNMEEQEFHSSLAAKVDVSVRMAQVFHEEPLDFVIFFSSMISFTTSPGQSNYAAGCTFKDGFAHQLAQQWSCPVKVMNWGYWGSVGVVASENYNQRMARAGIGSIESSEAIQALDALLAGSTKQIAFMKTLSAPSVN